MRAAAKLIAVIGSAVLAVSQGVAAQNPFSDFQGAFQLVQVQLQPPASYLGVRLADIDADRAATLKLSEPRGVEVVQVQAGSPAAKAGLKAGDVILTYNGENVLGAHQLGRLVGETPPDRHVKVQYWRDGKQATTTLITAPFRSFPNDVQIGTPVEPNVWPETNVKLQSDLMRLRMAELGMEIPTPIVIWKNSVLGLWCEPIDDQLAQYFGVKRGVLVRSVDKDGPADKAGVKAGDILVEIGERSVNGPRDVTAYMRSQNQPVRSVTVELTRNHKPVTVHILISDQQ